MRTQKKGTQIKRAAILNLLLFVFVYAGCKQPSVTINSYPISFSAIGGTVTASVDGKAITNGEFVGVGKTVTFTAHPQSGMKVSR